MPNVNELLTHAIRYDNPFLAYSIYTAVSKGIVSMKDEEEKFFASDLPFDEIQKALDDDSLLIKRNSVKLYLVKHNLDYAVYLAKEQKDVEQLHFKLFKEPAQHIVEASNKKDIEIYDEGKKRAMSFRDIQERTIQFPRFVCLMASKKPKKG